MTNAKMMMVLAGVALSGTTLAQAEQGVNRDEVRAIVSEMLSDAETRSSLLQGGGTAGYDKGFFLASSDNNFRLNIGGLVQFRHVSNFRSDQGAKGVVASDTRTATNSGFDLRRAAVTFSGHAVRPDLKYTVRLLTETTGGVAIDDAFVSYNLGNGWYVKGGQFTLGFMRESMADDSVGIAAERSIVEAAFGGDRTQGIEAGWSDPQYAFMLGFHDGMNSSNSAWNTESTGFGGASIAPRGERAYAINARGEWVFSGKREDLADYTAQQGQALTGVFGAAINWQQSRRIDTNLVTDSTFRDNDTLSYTVDLQVENAGFGFYTAFVGQWNQGKLDNTGAANNGTEQSANNLGLVVQGSYRFTPEFELFARYDGLFLAKKQGGLETGGISPARDLRSRNYSFVTFGGNYYFAGHAAKFTLDCVMGLNRTRSLTDATPGTFTDLVETGFLPNTNLGLLGTAKGLEAAVRAQFQLMF
ncbi:MAG: porin [Phycisphaerales bacterium]